MTVTPDDTIVYTITVTEPAGTASASATVSVISPVPAVSISAAPGTVQANEPSVLTWNTEYADTCMIEPGIGAVDLSGSVTVMPAMTTIYIVTASGPGGTKTAEVTITVNPSQAPVSIGASPLSIEKGGSSVLSWTSSGAEKAFIDSGIGEVQVNGSATVSPECTTVYILTVTGSAGPSSARVTVTVKGNPAPQPKDHSVIIMMT
ncbi:MAG: hypothetical protein GY749_07090 [Desulfobacteraceae bacterium]|nr:hypothetical protein [Desulfobacteraceae bacterium]